MKRYLFFLILFLTTLKGFSQNGVPSKRTYEYDDLNRLSKVSVYNGATLTHTVTYNYDDMGNRLSKVVNSSTTPTQTIAINSPISGTFTAGQSVTVTYASTGGTGNVSLELVSCTGTTPLSVIADGVAASGSTNHILPNNLTTGQYRIKAYVTGTSGDPYYGSCFTVNAIATQSIAISNPTSGTFTAGQSVSVSYASTNGSANVSLELVSCAGITALAVISANAAASGNTNYTLPTSLTAGSYRIKSYVTSAPEQVFYGSCFTVNASSGGDCPPTISHSGTITANTYNASQTIVSTANIPNNTKYFAGQSVTLLPGNSAGRGVNFEIRIQGCNTTPAPTNGLVLHLPFNNNANDASGNNFNGTASGNVTYAARGTGQSLNVAANAGQYITVPNNATLQNLSSMTLSAWVKPTAFNLGCYTEREMVVGKGKDVSATAFAMSISRNTTPSCGSASSFTTYKMSFEMNGSSIFSDTYSVDNQWKHVICIYDGTSQKIYMNGVLIQQQNIGAVNTSNTLPLYINYATWGGGASNTNGRYGGGIDEIRIYNRALSDAEVLQVYNAEKP
jgi:hypothetical protein